MIVTFTSYVPVRATLVFEDIFEEELQLEEKEKVELLGSALARWMYVDGELAGETYGVQLNYLHEKIEDCEKESLDTVYCYSTALLPKFRRKGLGAILKAYWLAVAKERGVRRVVGHATSEQAKKLNEMFGANFDYGSQHLNWFGTKRTAIFYWINL